MVKISVCLIAKNEERCIARCIRSFAPIASEIIVVDTGSADRTVAIAEGLGAKVYHFAWIHDFSAAKNFALSKASGDWIIFPDADDYLPNEAVAQSLRAAIEAKHGDPAAHAFSHTVRNFLGAGTEDSPYTDTMYCKVFRSEARIRYQRPLHEYIGWIGENPPAFNMLNAPPSTFLLYHDGYRDDLVAKKDERDLAVLEGMEGGSVSLMPAMARFYWYLGRSEEACRVFARYFESGGEDDKHTIEPHIFYIDLLLSLKKPYTEISRVLSRGQSDYPRHPGMRLLAGYAHYRAQRLPQAIKGFREGFALLESERGNHKPLTLMEGSHARFWGMLAELYALKGEKELGLDAAKQALARDPRHSGALAVLASDAPDAALAFLNGQYDLSRPDALKDLLPAFASNRPGVAFLTLFEKYFGLTQAKDLNYITMLAVAGEYSSAVKALLTRYEASEFEPYLSKALAFALLSENSGLISAVAKRGGQYARLAGMAFGEAAPAAAGDLDAFVLTAHFALGFSGVTPAFEDFASYAVARFGPASLAQLALLLNKHGCDRDMLDIADDAMQSASGPMLAAIACAGAESAFRAGAYERSERYLRLAREHGAHPYRLGSFAAFLAERHGGNDKNRLNALAEELFALDWREEARPARLLLLAEEAPDDAALVKTDAVSPQGF